MTNKFTGWQGRWGQWGLCWLFISGLFFSVDQQRSWAQTAVDAALSMQSATTIDATTTAATAGAIAGRVWKDANNDGIYQLEEPFLPATVVELHRLTTTPAQEPQISTTPLLTTTTTITGAYAFQGLPPGSYVLEFLTRGSMHPTRPNQGADESKDSDVFATGLAAQARSAELKLDTPGQLWLIDAGFVLSAHATIYVFDDTNRDNNRQIGEPVVLGAVVILHDSTGREVRRQVVDQRGAVLFADLLPGEYAVAIWPPEGYSDDPRAAVALSLAPGASVRLSTPVAATPKVIDLTTFTIVTDKNELVIRWVTAAEYQTYGYRLLRNSDVSAATTEQLTTEIIASKGTQGGAYEVRLPYRPVYDGPATAMEFWLIEYEITGKEQRYGPFFVAAPLPHATFLPLVITVR
jgi:hypothetical protein